MTTTTKGAQTKDRILEIAEASVLAKGFSNTSIDEIIAAAEITKSGFFYHFKDKTELAKALLTRFLDNDDVIMDNIFHRAQELSEDTLQAFLIGLKLFSETMANMESAHPGCMVSAVAYHDKQFNDEVRQLNADGVLNWRARIHEVLVEIAEEHPPKIEVDLEQVADMFWAITDGGIIISKVLNDPKVLADQVMQYRNYIRLIFVGY